MSGNFRVLDWVSADVLNYFSGFFSSNYLMKTRNFNFYSASWQNFNFVLFLFENYDEVLQCRKFIFVSLSDISSIFIMTGQTCGQYLLFSNRSSLIFFCSTTINVDVKHRVCLWVIQCPVWWNNRFSAIVAVLLIFAKKIKENPVILFFAKIADFSTNYWMILCLFFSLVA